MLRRGSTKIVVIVIACVMAVLALVAAVVVIAIVLPAVAAVNAQAQKAKDLEQVRGMGNGMTLYYKKYKFFPTLVDMDATTTTSIAVPRSAGPHCVPLKLLVEGGFVEDPKTFFSTRGDQPDERTLAVMSGSLDGSPIKAWAGTYAYDPGHNPNHGAVPFFGNSKEMAQALGNDTVHLLTCEQVAKEMECQSGMGTTGYVFANHAVGSTNSVADDIYVDESGTLTWRDAYMKCDVPAKLP